MALSCVTLGKLFRQAFPGPTGLRVPVEERAGLNAELRGRLAGLASQLSDQSRYYHRPQERQATLLLAFSLDASPAGQHYYYRSTIDFELVLDPEEERLHIRYGFEPKLTAPVGSPDEVLALVALCRERIERRRAQERKRSKVRHLKAQAITAQLKQMAREDKFDFRTESNERALKLFVRLSEADCCELQIPFQSFEEVQPHVRDAIRSLTDLHRRGLKFNLRPTLAYRGDWVRHQA